MKKTTVREIDILERLQELQGRNPQMLVNVVETGIPIQTAIDRLQQFIDRKQADSPQNRGYTIEISADVISNLVYIENGARYENQ